MKIENEKKVFDGIKVKMNGEKKMSLCNALNKPHFAMFSFEFNFFNLKIVLSLLL